MLEYGLLIALIAFAFIATLSSFDMAGTFIEPVAAILKSAPGSTR